MLLIEYMYFALLLSTGLFKCCRRYCSEFLPFLFVCFDDTGNETMEALKIYPNKALNWQ